MSRIGRLGLASLLLQMVCEAPRFASFETRISTSSVTLVDAGGLNCLVSRVGDCHGTGPAPRPLSLDVVAALGAVGCLCSVSVWASRFGQRCCVVSRFVGYK